MGASAEPQTNTGELNNSGYDIDPSYIPSDDEPFMNDRQLRYFEKQLVDWKNSILAESQGTLNQLQDGPMREPDLNDRASSETDWGIELRTRDRQRKLISKIESALRRITEGEYGYCQVTGEPISLARLRARPIATMSLEAQERHERHLNTRRVATRAGDELRLLPRIVELEFGHDITSRGGEGRRRMVVAIVFFVEPEVAEAEVSGEVEDPLASGDERLGVFCGDTMGQRQEPDRHIGGRAFSGGGRREEQAGVNDAA